jgi:hypothetical protein
MSATLSPLPSFVLRCHERPGSTQNRLKLAKSRQNQVKTGRRMANRHVSAGHVV